MLKAAGVYDWYMTGGEVRPPAARLVGYGGAAGGGKTDADLALAAICAAIWPGLKVGFFRRTYPELEGAGGAISRSREMYAGLDGAYNSSGRVWGFANGSRIYFRHLSAEKDKYKYQGSAFGLLIVDEATHFSWSMIDYLLTRNRAVVQGFAPFAVMTANPGGVGHQWYSGVFDVQDASGGEAGGHERVKHRQTPAGKWEDVLFIPARLEDNQILMRLDPDYARKLESREGDLVEALRWGNWRVFAGQAFRAWRREKHVMKPAAIPAKWVKWRAVDWGKANPFCCLWLTRSPDTGRVYVYREAYGAGLTDAQQAQMIVDMTPGEEVIAFTFADPSMWGEKSRKGEVYSSADEYGERGVWLMKADNDRLSGKRKVDRLLEDLPDGRPGLVVFETCANLIRTLPALVHDAVRVEDVDTTQEDHAYDALRYGLSNYKMAQAAAGPVGRSVWESRDLARLI